MKDPQKTDPVKERRTDQQGRDLCAQELAHVAGGGPQPVWGRSQTSVRSPLDPHPVMP